MKHSFPYQENRCKAARIPSVEHQDDEDAAPEVEAGQVAGLHWGAIKKGPQIV